MRIAVAIALLWVLAGSAAAQECRTIENRTDRLACYDKATPPVSKSRPASSKQSKSEDPMPARGLDFLSQENARLDAALKNICRGC